jgi:hypothetical protein
MAPIRPCDLHELTSREKLASRHCTYDNARKGSKLRSENIHTYTVGQISYYSSIYISLIGATWLVGIVICLRCID